MKFLFTVLGAMLGNALDQVVSKRPRKIRCHESVPDEVWGRVLHEAQHPKRKESFEQLLFRHGLRLEGDDVYPASVPVEAPPSPAPEKTEQES